MARFYLHLRNGSDELLDPDGIEVTDKDALIAAVLHSARDTMAGDVMNGVLDLYYRIDAEDAEGQVVHTLQFRDAIAIRTSMPGRTETS